MDEIYCRALLEKNAEKLESFKRLLLFYNDKFNLTAVTDENEIYIKHFYDSVYPQELFPGGASVAEIGSGGGFPSIPLKLVRDDLSFTLIESTGKKCTFLKEAVEKLSLDGVQVINIRAEDGGKEEKLREKFDVCCARAVASLGVLAEYCLPFVKIGGKFIAYKGDCDEEIEKATRAIALLGGKISNIYRYFLPSDAGKRTVIEIMKVSPTPAKYPRMNAQIKKKPL